MLRGMTARSLLVLLVAPGTALAHDRRTIANGKYDAVVGWDVEPAYIGMKNGASIRIMDAGTTNPVTGADKTLKLAIRQGASTQTFPLRAVFGACCRSPLPSRPPRACRSGIRAVEQ